MSEETKNWAAFGNEWLKAIEVTSDQDEYAIVNVSSQEEDRGTVLVLHLERGETKKKFGCNKTNLYAVQQECVESPEQAVGRIITFTKVQAQKPGTGEIVDGLRLRFKPKEEPKEVDTDDVGINEDGTM